jgi:prepilin-type N-terminal cleavage/methylation domain-containing protein
MSRKAFTLIELLIVVAIIAILAAIAVPNFLEAQTRSKVSRVKADMRSVATAVEAYSIDYNHYPVGHSLGATWDRWDLSCDYELTTPVSYLTSVNILDPFMPNKGAVLTTVNQISPISYFSYENYDPDPTVTGMWSGWGDLMATINHLPSYKGYCLLSWGPNRVHDAAEWGVWSDQTTAGFTDSPIAANRVYDATNGTVSGGDVVRPGGAVPGFWSGSNK